VDTFTLPAQQSWVGHAVHSIKSGHETRGLKCPNQLATNDTIPAKFELFATLGAKVFRFMQANKKSLFTLGGEEAHRPVG